MLLEILLLLVGLALIVFGADYLVNGSTSIARKSGVSEFVIGLTIVGMGTSMPEMVVSVMGALKGSGDIAIGNVVGSNIFNVFLILGVTALLAPMVISESTRKRDIPLNIAISVLLLFLGMSGTILHIGGNELGRVEALIMLAIFAVYMYYSFKTGKSAPEPEASENPEKVYGVFPSILMIIGGLAGLIIGGRMFVNSATELAKMMGVSDKFIAVTILAGGTSMPELATCVVAAAKKKGQLALGNIIGSNIFNLLLILGVSALIHPLSFENIDLVDMGALIMSSVVLLTAVYIGKDHVLDRKDGILFLICEAAYLAWLFINL